MEAAPRFELRVKDLQSSALPLGYAAITLWSGRRDSNPRFPPWQGGTLPLSHSRESTQLEHSNYTIQSKICQLFFHGSKAMLTYNSVLNGTAYAEY